ncbi:MAG: lamin tail domain-containing protein [Agriterribacter sp.]
MKITTLTALILCGCIIVRSQEPRRYDVLIHEIMANPSGSPALPNIKYIELYNASANAFDLKEWSINDGTNTATIRINLILEPDSFVVLCSNSGAPTLAQYGKTIGVTGFLPLRVNGDVISLRSADGALIHAVEYNRSWYENDVKARGGWSLEMVDAHYPCSSNTNWKASINDMGGTPGKSNSVNAVNKDETAPQPLYAYAADSLHTTIVFDEPIDSLSASVTTNYTISDGINTPLVVFAEPPLFNHVTITLASALLRNKTYSVTIKNISDCSGNIMDQQVLKTGLADVALKNDIVINEILFNPPDDGAEYVELYNRSNHAVNCKDLIITTRNTSGNLGTLQQLSEKDLFIFPGECRLLTEDVAAVQKTFICKNADAFTEISSMPTLPNSSGTIVILNFRGDVIDELSYSDQWQFPLISNNKGVALERIDFSAPTQDKNNWHSAAASVGYGTPTYQNSQFLTGQQLAGEINISPQVFSPDNDGYDDFLTVHYHFPEPGFVCNITIYDAAGRPVRYLVRNGLCGTDGDFRWDGLDEKNQKLTIGIYVIVTEVYNLQGKTNKFKQAVTLARRL